MALKNLKSLQNDDLTTSYDISGGAKLFKIPITKSISYSLQVIWDGFDQVDASVTLQGSNNNIDFDDLPTPNTKILDSASDSHSFVDRLFDHTNFAVNFDPGTATTGTLILLFKPRI